MSVGAPHREPAFNAPWPAVVLAAAILAAYSVQSLSGESDQIITAFAFSSAGLAAGQGWGLVTALFVHAGWTHALLNAVAALAFGSPVARRFGLRGGGPVIFFVFYLLCGAIGSLGFALVRPGSDAVLIGASGAVAGLMGASSRMLGQAGRLAPYADPFVLGGAVGWVIINLVFAVFGSGGFAGPGPIAWQAHLFGYAAGLALIGPLDGLIRGPSKEG
jgi:membrane associated rhomboid family serine protease